MRSSRGDVLAASVLVVCWSSGFVGAELGTRQAAVETLLAWRTAISAVVLGAWVVLRGTWPTRRSLVWQAGLGLLLQVCYLGGVFAAAAAGVAAGTSALVGSLQPLVVAALAGPVLGERSTGRQRAGLLLGAVGVGIVVGGDLGGGSAPLVAFLLPVGALVAVAVGTVLEQRGGPAESLITAMAIQSAVAAVVFGGVAAAGGELTPPAGGDFWMAVLWLVGLANLGGYGSYLYVIRRAGATRASALLYLTPPVTAAWAWFMFDQRPAWSTMPGMVVCAAGVALALRRSSRAPDGVGGGRRRTRPAARTRP